MKIWGLFLIISLLFFACTNPKPTPQAPNVNWTQLDEPPLFPDCPQYDVKLNWDCFAITLQKKLDVKWASDKLSFDDLNDTLYVTLKVDTLGQLSVVNFKDSAQFQSSLSSSPRLKRWLLPFLYSNLHLKQIWRLL